MSSLWLFLKVWLTFPCLLFDILKVKVKSFSRVRLFVTPWPVAYQAPLSVGFSRQEYWSGLPFPSPGDLPDPGIEPRSPALRQTLYRLSHHSTYQVILNRTTIIKHLLYMLCILSVVQQTLHMLLHLILVSRP